MGLFYPGRLRDLLAELRAAVEQGCPGARVRLTYAAYEDLDVLIEVFMSGRPAPATLQALGEHIGRVLAEGYAVRAIVSETPPARVSLTGVDLLLARSA